MLLFHLLSEFSRIIKYSEVHITNETVLVFYFIALLLLGGTGHRTGAKWEGRAC